MRPAKRLKRGLTRLLVYVAGRLINFVPRRFSLFVGATFGMAAWALLPRERHRIGRHLSLVYGDSIDQRQRATIAHKFFVGSGKNLVEVLRFRRHFTHEIAPLIRVEGLEFLDEAYRRGRGVIGFTGHIGNFELLPVWVATQGYATAVIGREMYDPRLDELLVANRQAFGVTNIATTDSARKVVTWLRRGGVLGVLIDIDSIRIRSAFVRVFGRLALTPVGQSIVGLRCGAAFVPCACLRTDDDRYRIIFRPEVTIVRTDDFEADVMTMTTACSQALEEIIDRHRDQWIWLKNRWLTRPVDVGKPSADT
jgi:KDO2-lipid IV(A) lauroyltransferase